MECGAKKSAMKTQARTINPSLSRSGSYCLLSGTEPTQVLPDREEIFKPPVIAHDAVDDASGRAHDLRGQRPPKRRVKSPLVVGSAMRWAPSPSRKASSLRLSSIPPAALPPAARCKPDSTHGRSHDRRVKAGKPALQSVLCASIFTQ